MSKIEFWFLPQGSRGKEGVRCIPHQGDSPTALVIVDMMAMSIKQSELVESASVMEARAGTDRCAAVTMTMDYFFGMIITVNEYLQRCRVAVERMSRLQVFESDLADCTTGEAHFAKLSSYHEQEVKEGLFNGSLSQFTTSRQAMFRHSLVSLQVFAEVLQRGDNVDRVDRVRYYAALVAPQSCGAHMTWEYALKLMHEDVARKQKEADIAERKPKFGGRKSQKDQQPGENDFMAKAMRNMDVTERDLYTDKYVRATLDWLDVAVAHVNCDDSPALNAWLSSEATSMITGSSGAIDHAVGPWEERRYQLDGSSLWPSSSVAEVFSPAVELARRPTSANPEQPPLHDEQSDYRYYLPDACMRDDVLLGQDECIANMEQLDIPTKAYCSYGWRFDKLPTQVRENCVFLLNLDNFRSKYSHVRKCSFGYWWENLDKQYRVARISCGTALASARCCMPSAILTNVALDKPVTQSKAQTVANAEKNIASVRPMIDLTYTALHRLHAQQLSVREGYNASVKLLRSGVSARCPSAVYEQNRLAMTNILTQVPTDGLTCDSTRACCSWINDKRNGFMGDKSELLRRVHDRTNAPDMEMQAISMSAILLKFEVLDVAIFHGPLYLMFCCLIDAMTPGKSLFLNLIASSDGGAGKSHMLELLILSICIAGTIVSKQYESACAQLDYSPSQMHNVEVHHEMNANLVNQGGKTKDSGDAAVAHEKSRVSEGTICTSTAVVKDGQRITVDMKKEHRGGHIHCANLGSQDEIAKAFMTRFFFLKLPTVFRENRNASDKNAHSTLREATNGANGDDLRDQSSLYFRQMQAYAFLYGTMAIFGGFMPVDTLAFEFMCTRVSIAVRTLGIKNESRTIERSRKMAIAMTQQAHFHAQFALEHGRHTGAATVDVAALVDKRHTWELEMIVSESCARAALLSLIDGYRQDEVAKVAVALMALAKKGTNSYGSMFALKHNTHQKEGRFQQQSNPHQYEDSTRACSVDLNSVQYQIPTSDNGMKTFCTSLAEALGEATGATLSVSHIRDILKHLSSNPAWLKTSHREMDMYLERPPTRNPQSFSDVAVYTVRGWKQMCKEAGQDPAINAEWLEATRAKWKANKYTNVPNTTDSALWPIQDPEGEETSTVTVNLDNWKATGIVSVSTAFLNTAASPHFVDTFEATIRDALNTSHGGARVIARPPVNMMEVQGCAPYLPHVEWTSCTDTQGYIENQEFISKANFANLAGANKKRSEEQTKERTWFPQYVPIDTTAAIIRIQTMAETRHTALPTAHQILKSDATGVCSRFGPHVLHLLVQNVPEFANLVKHKETTASFDRCKELAAHMLTDTFGDLMRHRTANDDDFDTDADGDLRAREYTLYTAKLIAEMAFARGMGRLRTATLNTTSRKLAKREIKEAKTILAMMKANGGTIDGLRPPEGMSTENGSVWERNRYATVATVTKHIAKLRKSKADNEKMRKVATKGINTKSTSLLQEWLQIEKKGVHDGATYVRYIRRKAKEMLQKREEKDGNWLRSFNLD